MLLSRFATAITTASVLCIVGSARAATRAATDRLSTDVNEPSPIAVAAEALVSELAFCANEINRYRSSIGLPALVRSADLEAFAMRAAANDGEAHVPHRHFSTTRGAGVAHAETEVLWWEGFTTRDVVKRGLAVMWEVGPGGEHYDIIAGPFSEIGCGIAVNGSEITVTQDFR